MTGDFELSQGDKVSSLWVRLCAHMEERVSAARQRNDKPLPEMETAMLRGEIKALTRLIALGDDQPVLAGYEQPPV